MYTFDIVLTIEHKWNSDNKEVYAKGLFTAGVEISVKTSLTTFMQLKKSE